MKNIFIWLLLFCSIAYSQFDATRAYSIMTKSTGRQLNAASLSTAKIKYVNDSWFILSNGDGTFQIKNSATNQVLGVVSGATTEGANLSSQTWTNSNSQKWTIVNVNNYYKIINVNSGKAATAINETPTITDPNPDIAYNDTFTQIGDACQKTFTSLNTQLFHITPIKVSNEEALTVPLLGWAPDMTKKALLILNAPLGSLPSFTVTNNLSSSVVLTGTMELYTGTTALGQTYYSANLSSITTEGAYTITSNGLSTSFKIDKTIYATVQGQKGTNISYQDMFDGFWAYNKYYPTTVTLPKATLTMPGGVETFAVNGTYDLINKGWFDAHSRDSKTARTAKVVSDFCLAWLDNTNNSSNQVTLATQIQFGFANLLAIQNPDGSWPLGKVREPNPPRTAYYWCINKDAYTTARAVKALALGYQVFKVSDPAYATQLLSAAVNGWSYITANESVVDSEETNSWKGQAADYFAAAVEMAYATGQSVYFDKADYFCLNGKYQNGIFKHRTTAFYSELTNRFQELETGTAVSIARYGAIARTPAMKNEVTTMVNDLVNYWDGLGKDPYDIPNPVFGSTSNFGQIGNAARMAYVMFGLYHYSANIKAKNMSESIFNLMTGLNPYKTSYIHGIGDSNTPPSASYFKRSYEFGKGAILPGFTYNGTDLIQDYGAYESTEGVIPTSSPVFYMLSRLNNVYNPTTPTSSTGYNGDFELGVAVKWNLFQNAGSVATLSQASPGFNTYNGIQTAKVDVTTLTTPNYSAVKLYSDKIDIPSGKDLIDINLFSKASSSSCTINIAIAFYDANNVLLSTYISGIKTLTTSFAPISATNIPVPVNATKFSLELRSGQVVGSYYYDDVTILLNTTLSVASMEKNNQLLLSPNPVNDMLNIVGKEITITQASLYAITGQKISLEVVDNKINVQHLSNGFYILHLKDANGGRYFEKIIIQH